MYSKGEVVWAKIKGFPWWPGVVAKVQEDRDDTGKITEILVNFIGENSHARLGLDKVAKFEENYTEYSKMKKKKLVESIEVAQRIIKGETTYEEESERLEKVNRIKPSSVENNSSSDPKGAKPKAATGKHSAAKELSSESDSDSEPSHISNRSPIITKPPPSEPKKKIKVIEKKEPIKKPPVPVNPKTTISTSADRSPMIVKPARPIVNPNTTIIQPGPIVPKDADSKDSGKNRAKKLLKLEDIEDSRLLKVPQPQAPSRTPADIIPEPERRSERNVPKSIKTQPIFETLLDEIVEMIANKTLKNFAQVSKKLETAIKKLEYEKTPVPDLIDKEVGKNLHTFLALVDKLEDIEADDDEIESIYRLRDFIIEAKGIVESRITRHFVENMDYLNHWLTKIEERADHKESDQETKITKESESSISNVPQNVLREVSLNNKGLDLESEPSPNQSNEKIDEEVVQPIEDKFINTNSNNNNEGSPKENHQEQNSSKNEDLKNQPTSSTKLIKEKSKTESVQSKKSDTPKAESPKRQPLIETQPQNDSMPPIKHSEQTQSLRKKICQKMSKQIQEKYGLQKEEAQKITLDIEKKVSKLDPYITGEYKSNILTILKTIRFNLCDARELCKSEIDFTHLRKIVEDYQKENVGDHDNMGLGDDGLTLTKDTKSDMEILNAEGVTVGVSN